LRRSTKPAAAGARRVRAVLDPNVIISGALSPTGATAEVLRACGRGEFELVASRALLEELARALGYPKLRRRIGAEDARAVLGWTETMASSVPDPTAPPSVRSPDPGDDYLIALACSCRAALVSGDKHLLDLADHIPVYSARDFLGLLSDRR
jgi:putative PIN family toxin of toxin-antitoxin system